MKNLQDIEMLVSTRTSSLANEIRYWIKTNPARFIVQMLTIRPDDNSNGGQILILHEPIRYE